MNPQQARDCVVEAFPQPFGKGKFLEFTLNLLNKSDESKTAQRNPTCIKGVSMLSLRSSANRTESHVFCYRSKNFPKRSR
ncbi:MAG: hypothetical protein JWM99_980 [Verrucomicrobiales bacterium]|nr:hypothetical protein [Verrucomicrobiales bacterium]